MMAIKWFIFKAESVNTQEKCQIDLMMEIEQKDKK
jgi:hypothetical protein